MHCVPQNRSPVYRRDNTEERKTTVHTHLHTYSLFRVTLFLGACCRQWPNNPPTAIRFQFKCCKTLTGGTEPLLLLQQLKSVRRPQKTMWKKYLTLAERKFKCWFPSLIVRRKCFLVPDRLMQVMSESSIIPAPNNTKEIYEKQITQR